MGFKNFMGMQDRKKEIQKETTFYSETRIADINWAKCGRASLISALTTPRAEKRKID